jgi:hypothetical protein
MKNITLSLFALLIAVCVNAQKKPVDEITSLVTKTDAEAHLTFLASDEMRGRGTGSPELEIAANYIASNFKQWGIKPAPGTNDKYSRRLSFKKLLHQRLLSLWWMARLLN